MSHRLSGTVPYRIRYRVSHTLMGPSCYMCYMCYHGYPHPHPNARVLLLIHETKSTQLKHHGLLEGQNSRITVSDVVGTSLQQDASCRSTAAQLQLSSYAPVPHPTACLHQTDTIRQFSLCNRKVRSCTRLVSSTLAHVWMAILVMYRRSLDVQCKADYTCIGRSYMYIMYSVVDLSE